MEIVSSWYLASGSWPPGSVYSLYLVTELPGCWGSSWKPDGSCGETLRTFSRRSVCIPSSQSRASALVTVFSPRSRACSMNMQVQLAILLGGETGGHFRWGALQQLGELAGVP